jgi:hypothetical protein
LSTVASVLVIPDNDEVASSILASPTRKAAGQPQDW